MYNHAAYLQAILNNPNTTTQEYLRTERELQSMQAQQNYLNQIAAQTNDKLTKGNYVQAN
jgi:hypothetical protein